MMQQAPIQEHEETTPVPVTLRKFDVEIVTLTPLRLYIFTASTEEYEEAIKAAKGLLEKRAISNDTFIECDDKIKTGVFIGEPDKPLRGYAVDVVEEQCYRIQNGGYAFDIESNYFKEG